MPSSIIHRCVSKQILNKVNLFNNDSDRYLYEIGSIVPDSWRNTDRFKNSLLTKKEKRKFSHFSKDGEYIENYDWFYNKYRLLIEQKNPFMIGYLVHLITDNFWRYNIFYKYFLPDGSVKVKDDSISNYDRKDLLSKETLKISRVLALYFNLPPLRVISESEINTLPLMDELDYDGINDSIDYNNKEITNKDVDIYQSKIFVFDDFVEGIDKCSNYIIDKLIEYNIIKR